MMASGQLRSAPGGGTGGTLTPEEEEILAAEAAAAAPLVEPGTPPPPTQQLSYPTGDYATPASGALVAPGSEAGYGQQVNPDAYVAPPSPAPQPIMMPDGSLYNGAGSAQYEYSLPPQTPQGAAEHPDAYDGGRGRSLVRPGTPPPTHPGSPPDYSGVRPSGLTQGVGLGAAIDAAGAALSGPANAVSRAVGDYWTRSMQDSARAAFGERSWTPIPLGSNAAAVSPAGPGSSYRPLSPNLPFSDPRSLDRSRWEHAQRASAANRESASRPPQIGLGLTPYGSPRGLPIGSGDAYTGPNLPALSPRTSPTSLETVARRPSTRWGEGWGNPFDAFKGLGSQEDMASPGLDLSKTGDPSLDWASPLMRMAEHSNPEVEAGAAAADRSTVQRPGVVDSAVQGWFGGRTSPQGRKQNLETVQNIKESVDLPNPGNTIEFRSDIVPGSWFRPKINWSASPRAAAAPPPLPAAAPPSGPDAGTGGDSASGSPPASPSRTWQDAIGGAVKSSSNRGAEDAAAWANLTEGGALVDGKIAPHILDRLESNGLVEGGKWTEKARKIAQTDPDTRALMNAGLPGGSTVDGTTLPTTSGPALPSLPSTGSGQTPSEASLSTSGGRASGGGGGSTGGGGSWRRGGGGSGGGSGSGGFGQGGGSRRSSFGDAPDDSGWEEFLRDFDNDGDTDEDDEKRARKLAMKRNGKRRSKRGKRGRDTAFPGGLGGTQTPIRESILAALTASLGRPVGGWPEGM